MRVITGTARGRRLETPGGQDTRPTGERVKEAVFSTIQFEVEGARVLDLFAGSGQMGVEALSRGAGSCVFVDQAKACQEVIRRNLAHTGLAGRAKVVGADALGYLRTAPGPFDIAFLDPPYAQKLLPGLLEAVAPLMHEGGVILCESAATEALPERAGAFVLHRQYRYGKTMVSAYRRGPA